MRKTYEWTERKAVHWLERYGYFAAVPTLLLDPAGVPWAWIFLMLLAKKAGKSIVLMLLLGCIVLTVQDHTLYWIGIKGGRPLVESWGERWPKLEEAMKMSEAAIEGQGIWAVTFGRYVPLVGRWVGIGAGLADVPYGRFILYDALGVALTVVGFGLLAHWVSRSFIDTPWFSHVVTGTFIVGTLLTLALIIMGMFRAKG